MLKYKTQRIGQQKQWLMVITPIVFVATVHPITQHKHSIDTTQRHNDRHREGGNWNDPKHAVCYSKHGVGDKPSLNASIDD
jgi:hypothetical protein